MDLAVVAALEAHFAIVGAALAPCSSGYYLNFAERPQDPVAFYGEETYARLREVKAEVDPLEIFRGNHEIPSAQRRSGDRERGPRPHGSRAGDLEDYLGSIVAVAAAAARQAAARGPARGSAPSEPRPVSDRTSSSS